MHQMTTEDRILTVYDGGQCVVLLYRCPLVGAGWNVSGHASCEPYRLGGWDAVLSVQATPAIPARVDDGAYCACGALLVEVGSSAFCPVCRPDLAALY